MKIDVPIGLQYGDTSSPSEDACSARVSRRNSLNALHAVSCRRLAWNASSCSCSSTLHISEVWALDAEDTSDETSCSSSVVDVSTISSSIQPSGMFTISRVALAGNTGKAVATLYPEVGAGTSGLSRACLVVYVGVHAVVHPKYHWRLSLVSASLLNDWTSAINSCSPRGSGSMRSSAACIPG